MGSRGLSRQVVWVSSNPPGVEHCTVSVDSTGWALSGTLVRRFREGTGLITYLIQTDSRWRTRRVHVEQVLNSRRRILNIQVKRSRWFRGRKEMASLRGCIDVDLQASPVTNSLPIKRAGLKVGRAVDLTAAWVRFPSLKLAPLRQGYERLGPRLYKYNSVTGFTAELEVDDFGLVRRYGDYWVAIDAARPS